MRIKNFQHNSLSRSLNEITQIISENGLQGLLSNQINDFNTIVANNEYLSNNVDIIGSFNDESADNSILAPIIGQELSSNVFNTLKNADSTTLIEGEFTLNFHKFSSYLPSQIHDTHSGILLIITEKKVTEEEIEYARLAVDDHQWLIFKNYDDFPNSIIREFEKKVCLIETLSQFEDTKVDKIILNSTPEKRSIYQSKVALFKMLKIISASNQIIKQEIKNSKSKKTLIQQKLTSLSDTKNFNASEIVQSIKNIVSQYSNNYDKSLISSYEQYLNIGNSEFLSLLEKTSSREIPISEIPKIKNIELVINESFLNSLYIDVEHILLKRFNTDISILLDSLNQIERDIESVFKKHNFIYQKTNIKYLTESDFQQILFYIRSKKPNYNSTAPLKGAMEYFSAARKFQMTFFMFLSMFGVSSVIRDYQYISIPLTVVLLGIGILNVYKNVNRERIENEEKEQIKAQEAITSYLKDVGTEIQRYWLKTLVDHFKTQLQSISIEVENQLKIYSQNILSQTEEEKKRNQKLISNFDQTERKLEGANRNFQPLERNTQRNLSDLDTNFSSLLRAERDERRKV